MDDSRQANRPEQFGNFTLTTGGVPSLCDEGRQAAYFGPSCHLPGSNTPEITNVYGQYWPGNAQRLAVPPPWLAPNLLAQEGRLPWNSGGNLLNMSTLSNGYEMPGIATGMHTIPGANLLSGRSTSNAYSFEYQSPNQSQNQSWNFRTPGSFYRQPCFNWHSAPSAPGSSPESPLTHGSNVRSLLPLKLYTDPGSGDNAGIVHGSNVRTLLPLKRYTAPASAESTGSGNVRYEPVLRVGPSP